MQKFWALGAPPPDPRASRGMGPCPHTPSSGGWGLRPQTPKTAPQCEFLATPLLSVLVCYSRIPPTSIRTAFSNIVLTLQQHTSARADFQLLYTSKKKQEIKGTLKMIQDWLYRALNHESLNWLGGCTVYRCTNRCKIDQLFEIKYLWCVFCCNFYSRKK